MRRLPLGCLLLSLLAACATDRSPTAPSTAPDIPASAFRVTIDVATGHVTVARPANASRRDGGLRPSLSLVGADVVELTVGDCAWVPAPNPKHRRCLLDLTLRNRLAITDLVTPTTFPTPPAGTNGVLVFPFTSAALTASGGGAALPTTDWDNAPINFFNDVGCSRGATDCYRYELFEGPLHGGETSPTRTVGFDVDRAAQTVAAYLVVAADLRDNPIQQLELRGTASLCGSIALSTTGATIVLSGPLYAAAGQSLSPLVARGVCSFGLPDALAGRQVVRATLSAVQTAVQGPAYADGNAVVVDHVDYGNVLTGDAFAAAAIAENIGTLSTDGALEAKSLDVTAAVQEAITAGRLAAQFRLRLFPTEDILGTHSMAQFAGPEPLPDQGPTLVVAYRNP